MSGDELTGALLAGAVAVGAAGAEGVRKVRARARHKAVVPPPANLLAERFDVAVREQDAFDTVRGARCSPATQRAALVMRVAGPRLDRCTPAEVAQLQQMAAAYVAARGGA